MGEHSQPPVSASKPAAITKFTISCKGLTNQMSVADIFVTFFDEDFRAGFGLDKQSEAWKDMDAPERRTCKNKFESINRAVRFVLLHADSHPLVPEDVS